MTAKDIHFQINGETMTCNTSVDKTFKTVIDENYDRLFPGNTDSVVTIDPYSWESLSFTLIEQIKNKYFFTIQSISSQATIGFLDRVSDYQNDFFNINLEDDGSNPDHYETISKKAISDSVKETLKDIDIAKDSSEDIDDYLLLENVLNNHLKNNINHFLNIYFSSNILDCINNNDFRYYREFLVSLIHKICILDFCAKKIENITPSDQFTCAHWIFNFLFSIQYNMMVVLNIPEIILRDKYTTEISNFSRINYYDLLTEKRAGRNTQFFCNFGRTLSNDDQLYDKFIGGCSLSLAYKNIFNQLKIDNYLDLYNFSRMFTVNKDNISDILHLFRIFYNMIKHSENISITTYGNAKKALRDRVEEEAYELIEPGDIADIEELKDYINERAKEKYSHDVISFSQGFKERNGIWIKNNDPAKKGFGIALNDIEFSVKLLFSVLHVITIC